VSEKYGTLGATVPGVDDYASGGADVPKAFREFTDGFGVEQGKGKLLVVQNTGAAAWKALKGDATLAEDGTLTIGAKRIVASMIADALKPSAGAAAGTEALRALGATASTATAGNDSRLSDTRTPTDGTVTAPKMAASAKELFPQLKTPGPHFFNVGAIEVNSESQVEVSHGLGFVPSIVLTETMVNANIPTNSYAKSKNETHIVLRNNAIQKVTIMWFAYI
jgi:hypothetical protein